MPARFEARRAHEIAERRRLYTQLDRADYRVRFERRDGAVVALVGRFRDGHDERSGRDR